MLRIFITNLGKYNEGELVGEWVDLPTTEDELEEVYARIGINEQYEEMFITDYETEIPGLEVGEYDNIEELNEMAEELENINEYDLPIIKAYLENGNDLEYAIEHKDDAMVYANCHDMEDVAREFVEETGLLNDVPENLQYYFDFKSYGRDMSFDGTFIFIDNDCIELLA